MEIVWIVWLADVFHSFIRRPFFHRKTSLDSGLYVTNHGFEDTVAAAVPDEVAVATDTFNDIFSLQPLDHTCNANNWERTAYHVVRYMNAKFTRMCRREIFESSFIQWRRQRWNINHQLLHPLHHQLLHHQLAERWSLLLLHPWNVQVLHLLALYHCYPRRSEGELVVS